MKRTISALVVMIVASWPTTAAHAQDEERGKALFFEGHAAADRGEHELACARFRESLAYFRRVSTLLNLGKCSDAIGELAEALRYWSESAALLEPADPRMALAKKRIAELDARVPRLRLALPEPFPERAVVELDGAVLTREEYASALRLNPGTEHRLDLVVPGHETRSVTFELAEGEEREIALPLGAAQVSAPNPSSAPPVEATGLGAVQIGGVVVGVVGLAGLVVGGITGALVLDRKSTVDTYCSEDLCTDPAGVRAAESGRTWSTVSTVAFIGGGAAVAAGVLMLVVGEPDDTEPLGAAAMLGPCGASVVMVGRF